MHLVIVIFTDYTKVVIEVYFRQSFCCECLGRCNSDFFIKKQVNWVMFIKFRLLGRVLLHIDNFCFTQKNLILFSIRDSKDFNLFTTLV